MGYFLCLYSINNKFTHNKTLKMKKLLFVCVLGAFAACGTGKTEVSNADSLKSIDSAKAVVDSTKKAVDTAKMMVDTAKAKVDSIKKN